MAPGVRSFAKHGEQAASHVLPDHFTLWADSRFSPPRFCARKDNRLLNHSDILTIAGTALPEKIIDHSHLNVTGVAGAPRVGSHSPSGRVVKDSYSAGGRLVACGSAATQAQAALNLGEDPLGRGGKLR
jgi:hypothetical protein